MIYLLPSLSFIQLFNCPTELYKIVLVPIATTYYYLVELHWSASKAKIYKASLFSHQNVSFAACFQFMDYSLVVIPENLHFQYLLELYTSLTCIQDLQSQLIFQWKNRLTTQFSRHSEAPFS